MKLANSPGCAVDPMPGPFFHKVAARPTRAMATFLLEIGTEELPADFARLALPQLEAGVARDLREARLGFHSVHATSTPRRLVVTVEGLEARQADLAEERKGPPAQQAFRDGQPTPAAIGFARRCGVDPTALEVRDTDRGPFVFARTLEEGQPALAVLPGLIPGWITALQGRRFMRWGEGRAVSAARCAGLWPCSMPNSCPWSFPSAIRR